ncbi:DUF4184 family protein [Chitinispirillales bacterium ANBcel5]|uniref:DUF4184 family protein n=1 Tax=Cellulosispirillum alkaliphilum TaxID=3039283 RepID=UPI002A56801B|nr:DUF4184 family protein [Chitinispirillales bacterium ANBcel5]
MPLTTAHPVVAVPFQKLGLSLSALIVGSVIPDFEFFLRLTTGRLIAHTIPGILLFCLPVGFLVLLIFHKFLKYPLITLLPHSHQNKLLPLAGNYTFFSIRRLSNIFLSLTIGALSHIVLDALTHSDGFFVELFPVLSATLFEFDGGALRVYFLLQYLISAIGMLLLVYWYYSWYKTAPEGKLERNKKFPSGSKGVVAVFMCAMTLVGGVVYGYVTIIPAEGVQMVKLFVSNATIAATSSFLLSLIVFAFLWYRLTPADHRNMLEQNATNTLRTE